jgi:hypothetical protein
MDAESNFLNPVAVDDHEALEFESVDQAVHGQRQGPVPVI